MKYLIRILFLMMLISTTLYAEDISITGTISQTIKIPPAQMKNLKSSTTPGKVKKIKLLKIQLSDKAQHRLSDKAHHAFEKASETNDSINMSEKMPVKVELGMNGVPVLNQGNHGTCATFAVTAALNATLEKGDYISQLCQLQVGNYLAAQGYGPSGWDGSLGRLVLSQMDSIGFISKQRQMSQGCGGLQEYPINGDDPTSFMALEEFHQISEPLDQESITWWTLLDIFNAGTERLDTNNTLFDVKNALANGDRVVLGTLLLDFEYGQMGAVGKKNTTYDTWVLTPEIARDVYLRPFFGGHAMVITGYDDNAVAIDDKGRSHRGLLTLRNSWGDQAGDHGNFYMSYDYFKLFVLEALRIHNAGNDDKDREDSLKAYNLE